MISRKASVVTQKPAGTLTPSIRESSPRCAPLPPASAHFSGDPDGYYFIGGDPMLLIEDNVPDGAPVVTRPVQQPHPPLWYGTRTLDRALWCARLAMPMMALVPSERVRPLTDAYRAEWKAQGGAEADIPCIGVFRHVVVAATEDKAREAMRSAYRQWRHHMAFLWEWGGVPFPIGTVYPEEFDKLEGMHMGVAGTPETVRRYITETVERTGINYFVADMSFGSLPYEVAAHSVDLFAKEVMPAFR